MAKKLVEYTVKFAVEDGGELDSFVMRDGLEEMAFLGLKEGLYTKINDTSTVFTSITVSHVSTLEERL